MGNELFGTKMVTDRERAFFRSISDGDDAVRLIAWAHEVRVGEALLALVLQGEALAGWSDERQELVFTRPEAEDHELVKAMHEKLRGIEKVFNAGERITCSRCGRSQAIGEEGKSGPITKADAIMVGWAFNAECDLWHCPFCTGNTSKLREVFEGGGR